MNSPTKKNILNTALKVAASVAALLIVGTFSYFTLSKINNERLAAESSQEQFAGGAQVSGALQSECQRAAESISSGNNIDIMFAEYKKNADNCREAYFSFESKNQFRNEGMFLDLAVDMANFVFKANKSKATEILNFAKGLNPWAFYMGPVTCNSKNVMEAYLESYNLPEEKFCIQVSEYKDKLVSSLKNRDFSIFYKTLSHDRVVTIGALESEVGCPEKISSIVKIAESAARAEANLVEEKIEGNENNDIGFIFKTANEDKLILKFSPINNCLQLQSVLIPNSQANE